MTRRVLLCSLLLASLGGCVSEREVYARTQIMLQIDTADDEIRRNLSALKVALFAEAGDGWEPGTSAQFEVSSFVWPMELPVVPRRSEQIARSFEVVVDGLDGREVYAQTRAVTRFLDGKQLVLSLRLERCQASDEPVCEASDCHGPDCKVCRKGMCVRAESIDPKELVEWSESSIAGDGADAGKSGPNARVDAARPKDGGRDGSDKQPSESCEEDGQLRCAMAGGAERERCESGRWQASEPCPDAQVCDVAASEPGSCRELVAVCVGSSAQTVCDREVMLFCNGQGGSSKSLPCKSASLCERGKAAGACAACVANEYRCTGAELEICAEDGQSFVPKESCSSAALCNAAAGSCGTGCKAGSKSCQGDELQVCGADGSGFSKEKGCEPGMCDGPGQQCDVCVPGTKSCEGNVVQSCAADGQRVTGTPCAAPRGICTGNGTCVECSAAQPCAASTNPCMTTACNVATGSCETKPKAADVACPTGYCDGEGQCGECRTGETKACGSDVGECSAGRQTCTEGRWGACSGSTSAGIESCNNLDDDCDGTIDDGASCSGVRNRCIGGRCVQCGTGAACPTGQSCTAEGLCESTCGNSKKESAESCDPTAPGYTTFTCTDDCKTRAIYNYCAQDPNDPFGPGSDCKTGEFCAGYGGGTGAYFCVPQASTPQGCPAITGYTWVLAGLSNKECLLPCSPGRTGDCPSIAPICFTNPFSATPAGWCTR